MFPAVHSAPADFSFGSKPFTVVFGDGACLAKCFCDSARVCAWIFSPCDRARSGINPHNAVLAYAKLLELLANCAGLANLGQETIALLRRTHGGTAANRRPHGGHQRSGNEIMASQLVGKTPQVVVGRINVSMG